MTSRISETRDEFPVDWAPDSANPLTSAFDLLAERDHDWRPEPYDQRRGRLEELFTAVEPPLQLIPHTTKQDQALPWLDMSNAQVGVEGLMAKARNQPYRAGRTGDWRKIRSPVVVDAVVIGLTGALDRPAELVLARPDETGDLRQIGLSLPLDPRLRAQAAGHLTATGEPPLRLSAGLFGRGRTEYRPVYPELIVEAEAESSVASFSSQLRPKVHRLRPDLTVEDL